MDKRMEAQAKMIEAMGLNEIVFLLAGGRLIGPTFHRRA